MQAGGGEQGFMSESPPYANHGLGTGDTVRKRMGPAVRLQDSS